MSTDEVAAWVQALAAGLTFLAACWAVVAAYQAPRLAAEFAEKLRREHAAHEEIQRQKQWILSTLMRYRGQMLHFDVVAALNMIDITFVGSKDVREAYQQFWNASNVADTPPALQRERFYKIVETIVRDLGMGAEVRSADIERAYFPYFVSKQLDVEMADTDRRWNEIFGKPSASPPVPKKNPRREVPPRRAK